MLIGIYSPAPGCGKTTVARYLEQRGFKINSFATPIKDMTRNFLMNLGYNHEEAVEAISTKTDTVKGIDPPISVRDLLRTLGTEWGRDNVHPEVWIKCWLAKYEQLINLQGDHFYERTTGPSIVVDDVRFLNEAKLITKLGGKLWELRRTDAEATHHSTHRSDGGLTGCNFDKTIYKNGSIEDLHAQILEILIPN